ncbi:MAG: hypothetical protein Q7W51_00775 [Coriobacteriia bacterium]|nr:hypothetical protein [Coriobacteriia bacterium]
MRGKQPSERGLTSRENWPEYIGGLVTEAAFILGLTLIAFVMALVAKAVL